MHKLKVLTCLGGMLLPCLLTGTVPAAADEVFKATGIINVPIDSFNTHSGLNSFDISFDDEVLQIYTLSDRSNKGVDLVDTTNNSISVLGAGAFTGVVMAPSGETGANLSGPNGNMTVDNREVWAGDGNSTVKVIDIFTNTVTHNISTSTAKNPGVQRADEMCWDPVNHIALVANDSDAAGTLKAELFITFISTDTHSILGQIEFRDGLDPNSMGVQALNGIEQCKWSPRTGMFYLNIPQTQGAVAVRGSDNTPGAVLQIDPHSLKVEKVFPINFGFAAGPPATADCLGNQGMALGPSPEILLGCSAAGKGSVIIDEHDGHLIANLPGENGNDEVWYNPGDNQFFMAESSNPAGPTLGVVDGNGSEDPNAEPPTGDTDSTSSATGSHSVAADPFHGQVFVPVNNSTAQANNICSSLGGSNAQGCIAIYTSQGRDDKCLVAGAAVVAAQDGDPQFLRVLCPRHDDDRHHYDH